MSGWGPSLERLRASRWGVAGEVDVGKVLLHHPNHCLDRAGESGLVLQTRPTVFDFLSLRIEKQNGWRKTKLWTVPIGRRNVWILAWTFPGSDFCSGTLIIVLCRPWLPRSG